MKIYYSDDLGLGTHLERLYQASDKHHQLVDKPKIADLIFVKTDKEEVHKLAIQFPAKCFSLYGSDGPFYFSHGIYTNGEKSIFTKGRIRTGCYQLTHSKNPFIHEGITLPEKSKYLASFMGRNCHPVRDAIFSAKITRQDIFLEDSTDSFDLWGKEQNEQQKSQRQKYFRDILIDSKFSICPRGTGANSIRLFESMQLGVAPVIISDDWILPRGPDWARFSLKIKEAEIGKLQDILEAHENDYKSMGKLARKAHEAYFSEQTYFNYLVGQCAEIMDRQWIPESLCRNLVLSIHNTKTSWARIRRQVGLRSRIRRLVKRKY